MGGFSIVHWVILLLFFVVPIGLVVFLIARARKGRK